MSPAQTIKRNLKRKSPPSKRRQRRPPSVKEKKKCRDEETVFLFIGAKPFRNESAMIMYPRVNLFGLCHRGARRRSLNGRSPTTRDLLGQRDWHRQDGSVDIVGREY
ncbi:hypothetical protein GCWU000246_00246 [Jonquetella anthropi E3_33 E1]|nr:hypothetical protein GCWU000246_00246 [Jonquetella anthropi E3_33 E1]